MFVSLVTMMLIEQEPLIVAVKLGMKMNMTILPIKFVDKKFNGKNLHPLNGNGMIMDNGLRKMLKMKNMVHSILKAKELLVFILMTLLC